MMWNTLGLISIVRNSLKLAWGCIEWSFFSSCISHPGARWTFSSITHLQDKEQSGYQYKNTNCTVSQTQRNHISHLPDLTAVLMSLSALLKPSAEPVESSSKQLFTISSKFLIKHLIYITAKPNVMFISFLPIEIEVICLFCSAARSLTSPLAS